MTPSLSLAQVEQLFTMTLAFNQDLILEHSSAALQKRCPQAKAGAHLLEVFDIHRPHGAHSFEQICQNAHALFLLIAKDRRFALRGQLVIPQDTEQPYAIFLGSPWMSWISSHQPDMMLTIAEYPRHDSQLDHQFYVVTQQAMVRDLETANQEARAARDEAQRARQIQSDFFAVMSHEMRTPLNGVISALDLINGTDSAQEIQQLLRVAQSSSKNLLSVINYVLDYSKMQAGKLQLEEESFDLHTLLQSVLDIIQPKAREKGLDVRLQLPASGPMRLLADASKIRQIILNLASNAVKFTEHGSVLIKVSAIPLAQPEQHRLTIEVEDTGVGISAEQRPHIFDAFWTSHEHTARGEANTGLGLNICHRLAELMQGELSFRSEPGRGSCFALSLSVKASQAPATPPISNAETPALLGHGRILLVDDNQVNLLVGRLMLERMGLSVETASDGLEAIAKQAKGHFDLILMDITMPTMGGVEATQQIRAAGDPVPIIALTAHIGPEQGESYVAAAMQDVVHKPIDKAELIQALKRWLPAAPPTGDMPATQVEQPDQAESVAGPTAKQQCLDDATLKELMEDIGEDNFQRALGILLPESKRRMQTLEAAWQQRDLNELANEAHTLSSSLSSFGAKRLGGILRELEHAAAAQDETAVAQLLPQMSEQYHHAHQALTRLNTTDESK